MYWPRYNKNKSITCFVQKTWGCWVNPLDLVDVTNVVDTVVSTAGEEIKEGALLRIPALFLGWEGQYLGVK